LCCTLLTLASAVHAQAQRSADEPTNGPIVEEIVVEETAGAVKIKFDNRWQSPSSGMTVSLPATVSTGADGSIRIRQAATVISVASNTAIELLEGTEPGSPLQRVVQNQGSAFYDIAPQESSRLRVETPYLVAVIKGTEFNVTVAAETSTVALFEGRLQVEAPGVGDVVDLHQGQIAKRHKDDPRITVLSMQDGEPVARGDGGPPGGQTVSGDEASSLVGSTDGDAVDDDDGNDVDLDLALDAVVGIGDSIVDPGVDAGLDLAGGDVEAELDVRLDLGDAAVDLGMDAGLDLDGGDIDLGLDGDVDLGSASVDTGLDAGVDLAGGEIDLGMDSGLDLGGVGVDAGFDAGVDLDDGDIDAVLDAGIDLGDAALDAELDTGVDLDDGGIDAVVDAGIDLGDTALDAGLDVGVDLGGDDAGAALDGGVDLDVAGVEVDIGAGIDLGDLDDVVDIDLGLDLDLLGDGDTDSDSDGIEEDEPDLPINPRDLFDLLGL
jgi:hypothetical protein